VTGAPELDRLPPAGPPAPGRGRFRWRGTTKWVLGVLFFIDIALLLGALSFDHATTEGPAKRGLRHSTAILTEVDAYLDDHYETIRQDASEEDQGAVTPPDFPVEVSFAREEVLAGEREAFRALLLTRAADRVYEDGADALEAEEGGVDVTSAQGAVRSGMDLLRSRPHRVLSGLTIALAAVAGALAIGLALTSRGYGRLLSIGLGVFLASVPFLIMAIAMRFAFRVGANGADEYLAHEFFELGQELTWAPIRNGIIFSVGGAAMFVFAAALALWSDRRAPG